MKDVTQRPRRASAQRRRLGLVVPSQALVQKRVASFVSWVCCFFASRAAWLRARPATALAPLSHMLMNGFFFVHGFATGDISLQRHAPYISVAGRTKANAEAAKAEGSRTTRMEPARAGWC